MGWPEKWPAKRFSGGSSSVILGIALQSTEGGCCGCLRAHGIVLSTKVCSDTSCGGYGHGGDNPGGVEFSAKMGLWPRGQKRPGEKGETTRGLTVVT